MAGLSCDMCYCYMLHCLNAHYKMLAVLNQTELLRICNTISGRTI